MIKKHLIITSIASPNPVLKSYAELCRKNNVVYTVIGDTASPKSFKLAGCDFWSVERQLQMPEKIAKMLPTRHYSRKNLGYVIAKKNGAGLIVETDDDNFAMDNFFNFFPKQIRTNALENRGWHNVYHYFSKIHVWPRGYPLDDVRHSRLDYSSLKNRWVLAPIQQGLANDNPDVDAVYRLTGELPLTFDANKEIALGKNTWCPFNAQNTVWYAEAFPLLYLPSYCSFRMTDIWRSFVAQRIAWENRWHVLFYSPTVRQERNEHDLMKDFADEIPGYLNNRMIAQALQDTPLKKGESNLFENLIRCYQKLIDLHLIGTKELPLIEAWIEAIG